MGVQHLETGLQPVKLTVSDYLSLDGSEAFGGRYSELIDGHLYFRPPRFAKEVRAASNLAFSLMETLRKDASKIEAGMLGSVDFAPHDAPSPDITLSRELRGEGLIPGLSALLIVEVADETLELDMTIKRSIYARNHVPEYWVVDVNAGIIHQMWAPDGETYSERREVVFRTPITAATIAGLQVMTDTLR